MCLLSFFVTDNSDLCKMNTEDKLEGMLLKCSSGGLDGGGRVGLGTGTGLVGMTLGERSLVNHPILAEDDDEDDDEDLTGSSLVTHDLVPPEQLMMQEDLSKNDGDDESESEAATSFPLKLTNKLPCLLHMPVGFLLCICQLFKRVKEVLRFVHFVWSYLDS